MTAHEELLKKIKVLSEHGERGERDTASKMLKKLMDKYGITETDLNEEKVSFHWFKYTSKQEVPLLGQIIYMVTGIAGKCYKSPYKRKQLGCECTIFQSLEIEALFGFYKRKYKEDLKVFYDAFLIKNDLFPDSPTVKSKNEIPDEQWEKACEMSTGMERHNFQKQIAYRGRE